jgi:hypothetical protein
MEASCHRCLPNDMPTVITTRGEQGWRAVSQGLGRDSALPLLQGSNVSEAGCGDPLRDVIACVSNRDAANVDFARNSQTSLSSRIVRAMTSSVAIFSTLGSALNEETLRANFAL